MAFIFCYIPAEKIREPELWVKLRTWQKTQDASWDKIRITPDFLQPQQCMKEELNAALTMLRNGAIRKVVYIEARSRALSDLDWLAFACSCIHRGVSVENDQAQSMLSAKQAEKLQLLFGQAKNSLK